jgi:hypothetical protein
LKNHYKIPINLANEMVDGFLVGICKRLVSITLLRAKKEEIDQQFICNLIFRKFHR